MIFPFPQVGYVTSLEGSYMNLKKHTSTLEIVRVSLHGLIFSYQSIKPGDITNGFIQVF